MQKQKIIFTAMITMFIVGIINSTSALVAYSLVVPPIQSDHQSLLSGDSDEVIVELPTPQQSTTEAAGADSSRQTTSTTVTGEKLEFRAQSNKLEAGKKPQPTAIATNLDGTKTYKWCSGVNPDLPDEVCQAIISIAASPVESNPHLSSKAKESLSLLPKNSSITMDEGSWKFTGTSSGTMLITTSTAQYGDVKLRIFLEKQLNLWVLTDGQLA